MNGNFQSYLKIISWEDFRSNCVNLDDEFICCHDKMLAGSNHCHQDNRSMITCPIWKTLRDFYTKQAWDKIKQEEESNGRCDENQRKAIAQEYHKNRRRHNNIRRWDNREVQGQETHYGRR